MTTSVLICDDSSVARKQMARTLGSGWDFSLSFATNGAEAIDAIKAGKGDLLLLDLNMPVMDGYQTLEAIRREGLNTIPIVVSGDIQPEARERVMRLGALAFIRKPVVKTEIDEVLTRYGLVREAGAVASLEEEEGDQSLELQACCQEAANIAMGQAAELLARLLDVFVVLPIPNVNLLEPGELAMTLSAGREGGSVSVVSQGFIGGGIGGEALLLVYDTSREELARLLRRPDGIDDSEERELLMDMTSLLIGAFLKGFAEQLDVQFSQGHPVILGQHIGTSEIVRRNTQSWNETLAIEISYAFEEYDVHFDLMVLITEDSLDRLRSKLAFLLE
ncbi:MAG: response regulator [Gammaproteobacteria bacterium]